MIQEAEALFAKFGQYEIPEEYPFFPENLRGSCMLTFDFPQDRDALIKMLTFKKVEVMVKRTVEKKVMIFGQEVTLDDGSGRRKIDPGVVSRLYDECVIPLTKEVEVEYLLRSLD